MDETTNAVQESNIPQAYAEEKTGFFAKVKNGAKKHGKGMAIGALGTLLIGGGLMGAKAISSKGIDVPIDVPFEDGGSAEA